uniref:Glycogen phosphorylase n=1 Tax=Ascaris lumbricoides TaxID=6252 RepID=A0A0M3IKL9_ASCLU
MFQQSFNVVDNDCYYQMRGIPSVGRCVFPALW